MGCDLLLWKPNRTRNKCNSYNNIVSVVQHLMSLTTSWPNTLQAAYTSWILFTIMRACQKAMTSKLVNDNECNCTLPSNLGPPMFRFASTRYMFFFIFVTHKYKLLYSLCYKNWYCVQLYANYWSSHNCYELFHTLKECTFGLTTQLPPWFANLHNLNMTALYNLGVVPSGALKT